MLSCWLVNKRVYFAWISAKANEEKARRYATEPIFSKASKAELIAAVVNKSEAGRKLQNLKW